VFVPALAGLGSPWWDPNARGTLMGLSRGVTRAHVARAVVDALSFQGRAMLDAMRDAIELDELRVDGGAATMDLLCQELADSARLTVRRPSSVEATAVGAALVAGIAVGACSLASIEASWEEEAAFHPRDATFLDIAYDAWLDGVARARSLGAGARPGSP
jgi:glycerol kinase